MNPVLRKELKTKARTWKTPIMISLYIAILVFLVSVMFLQTFVGYGASRGISLDNLKGMFYFITVLQLGLIIFIVPATTSSSISGEVERSTFDLLLCTRLSSISIVLGKLMASLVQITLLLFVSIPVLSISFLVGGVSPGNILVLFGFYFITAILYGSIGIFTSAFFRKTATSTVVSYLITMFLCGGTFIITVFLRIIQQRSTNIGTGSNTFFPAIFYANPFTGLLSILGHQTGQDILNGLTYRGANSSILTPLYINIGFSVVATAILIYLTSLKINPMNNFGNKVKKKKVKQK